MKNNNYIVIQGWMVNELKLKGNDLLIYALIFGFSQDGDTEFRGTIKYICASVRVAKNTAIRSLDKLVDLGLITKRCEEVSSVVFNRYSAIERGYPNWVGGIPKMGTNNSIDNTNNNIKQEFQENLFFKAPKGKHQFDKSPYLDYDFLKKKLIEVYDAGVDLNHYYYSMKDYSSANQSKKYNDWSAVCSSWMRRDKTVGKLKMRESQEQDKDLIEFLRT